MQRRKRIFPSLLCGWIVLSWLIPLLVQPARAQGEARVVRVGYTQQDGFISRDGSGRLVGFGRECLDEISLRTGWEFEFVEGSWEENRARLRADELDLVSNIARTWDRAGEFIFSRSETGLDYAVLQVPAGDEVYYEDFAAFDGMRIGMARGFEQGGDLARYAAENGFGYEAVWFADAGALDGALVSGAVDAAARAHILRRSGEQVVARFAPTRYYFAATPQKRELMDALDAVFEEIRVASPGFFAGLGERYMDEAGELPVFTRAEAQFIAECPVLRVAYDPQWAPLEYTDADGRAQGITVELIERVAALCGLTLEFVPSQSSTESVSLLESGGADLICSYLRDGALARGDGVALSDFYLDLPMLLIARSDAQTVSPVQIGIARNYYGIRQAFAADYPGAEMVDLPGAPETLCALAAGEVDCVAENIYSFQQMLQIHGFDEMQIVTSARRVFPLSVALRADADPRLIAVLNKGIATLGDRQSDEAVWRNLTEAVRGGELLRLIRRYAPALVAILTAAFAAVIGIVLHLSARSERILQKYAFTDPLTGSRNWTRFMLDADKLLDTGADYAMVKFDIDRFKLVNDMHGFETGDSLLRHIDGELAAVMQEDELYCRVSDDNFAALLHAGDELDERVDALLERVCDAPAAAQRRFRYTASCGIYVLRGERGGELRAALDRADLALRRVKGNHYSSAAWFTDEMRITGRREKEIENRAGDALKNGEFVVYYQPKYSLAGEELVGAEALVRWKAPEGIIGPDEFIRVFENNGFIVRLDLYVFEQVCRDLSRWAAEGKRAVPVSVNLSRVHLYEDTFYEEYVAVCDRYGVPRRLIEMELTENMIFDNQDVLVDVMNRLRALGFLVSMDDFGSGYSSLNLLKDAPIDVLKIDKSFLEEAADTQRGRTIIASVVTMARQLSIVVLTEGVETREQADFLRAIGCDAAQGYYFSRPLTREDFEQRAFGTETGIPQGEEKI